MKKILLIVLSCLILLSMPGLAAAVEKVKVKHIAGEVAAVDAAANSLTVRGKRAEVVITANEKTSVKLEKKNASLADLKIGDKVTVKYSETDGKNIARSIETVPAKTEKTPLKVPEPVKSPKK